MGKRAGGHSGRCCAVVGCANNSKKLQLWKKATCEIHAPQSHADCPCLQPYSLHRFPGRKREVNIRRRWIENVNRKDFAPKPHSVICGTHFPEGRPTETHPYPVLKMGGTKLPGRSRKSRANLEQLKHANGRHDSVGRSTGEPHEPESRVEQGSVAVMAKPLYHNLGIQWYVPTPVDHNYHVTTDAPAKTTTSTQTDWPSTLSAQDLDEKACRLYTGLSKGVFWALVEALVSSFDQPVDFSLAVPDQILLVLVRLRLGLTFTDLCCKLNVPPSTACDIFAVWIHVVADLTRANLVQWLPQDQLKEVRPKHFTQNIPHASFITHCAEISVEQIQRPEQQAHTYDSTRCGEYKALFCIAPNGFVMFVSKLFSGCGRDISPTQSLRFLDQLSPSEKVLADMTSTSDVLPSGARLVPDSHAHPPHTATDDGCMDDVRVRVERAVRRLKCFRILGNVITGSLAHVDDILLVCAGLCNLQPPFVEGEEDGDQ